MNEEWVLLLPENPDQSADKIRKAIEAKSGVRIGVLINDSHGRAWRIGTVGTAIGISGIPRGRRRTRVEGYDRLHIENNRGRSS